MDFNFDVSQFIAVVKDRSLLYDPSVELYMDREAKQQAWEEIVAIMLPAHESGKSELVISLQKKWKNIRDTFVREVRRNNRKKKYKHYRELLFLKDLYRPRLSLAISKQAEDAKNSVVMDSICPSASTTVRHSPEKKRRRDTESDESQSKINRKSKPSFQPRASSPLLVPSPPPALALPQRTAAEEEGDKLFLLSLLSDLKRVPEQLKLEVKCELMNVIKRYSSFSNPQDTLQNCIFTVAPSGQEEIAAFAFKTSPQHSSEDSD